MIRCLVVLIVSLFSAFAQPPDTLWTREYCGDFSGGPGEVIATSDAGWLMGGAIQPAGQDNMDGFVRRLDWFGNILWDRSFGEEENDYIEAVTELPDGSLAFAGVTASFGELYGAAYIVKTDAQGHLHWRRHISQNLVRLAVACTPAPNGSIALAGLCSPDISGGAQSYLMLLDMDGNMTALRTYGGGPARHTSVHAMSAHPHGGWVLAGWSIDYRDTTNNAFEGWLLRVDADGDSLWGRSVPNTFLRIVHATPDGDILVGGIQAYDLFYQRLDSSGTLLFQTFPRLGAVELAQYNLQGKGFDNGQMVFAGSDLNYFMPGSSVLFMTDIAGDSLWLLRLAVPLESRDISGLAGSLETGLLWKNAISKNYDPCHYHDVIFRFEGTQTVVPPRLEVFGIPVCYPNPFNTATVLEFDSHRRADYRFVVFDILGRERQTFDLGTRDFGTQRVTLAIPDLASGKYFGQLSAGSSERTVPLIVIR